jgi:nitrogen fixation protein NifB
MPANESSYSLPVLKGHPCFDEAVHDTVGRVHLPVAPACNIQCAFCDHTICANLTIQHPGWTRVILGPSEALDTVSRLVAERPDERFVVGVAGPGEPLANGATLQTLAIVHCEFPHLTVCISSNGLLLEEMLPELVAAGVTALTVTVNAADAEVGQQIYRWVRYHGETYRGREGAELLLERQLAGIRAALAAGLAVKMNSVLIPRVNADALPLLAQKLHACGVRLHNIMPLIPGGEMAGLAAPTCDELRQVRDACAPYLAQFRRCEHCRADVQHFPKHGERYVHQQQLARKTDHHPG